MIHNIKLLPRAVIKCSKRFICIVATSIYRYSPAHEIRRKFIVCIVQNVGGKKKICVLSVYYFTTPDFLYIYVGQAGIYVACTCR